MGKKNTIRPKINKLIKALRIKHGLIVFYNLEQVFSNKLEKVCTIRKVTLMDKDTGKKDLLITSFKEVEILLKLVELYKQLELKAKEGEASDDKDGKEKDTG